MSYNKENYICLSAMLRARETKLLTNEKAQRMIDAPGMEEAAKILVDCGYEDMGRMNTSQIEESLKNHLSEILLELKRLTPDKEVVDLFLIKNDYHNLKTLIKGEAAGTKASSLLSSAGRILPEALVYAYTEESYRDLTEEMTKALISAKEVMARTSNPQKADFILDKAYFEELKIKAAAIGSDFVSEYIALLIDIANLKSLIRSKKMGKGAEFLREALIDGGSISIDRLLAAGDGEAISAIYASTSLEETAEKGKEALEGGRMTEFELAADNALSTYLKKSRLVTYGAEAVVSYLASVESEITAVRIILTCKLTGVPAETIKERLRDMYA